MLLTSRHPLQAGVTLIELMIAVALVGVLLLLGLPDYAEFMRNGRIRNAAESTALGLKLARAEAIRRNVPVRFDLVSTLDAGCTQSASTTAWTISLSDPAGKCDTTPGDMPNSGAPLLRTWINTEGARDVTLKGTNKPAIGTPTSATTVVFTPMGRISAGAGDLQQIDIATTATGRNLRILIDTGGSIFMCDPNIENTNDSRWCP